MDSELSEEDLNGEYDARLGDGDRDDPEPQTEPTDADADAVLKDLAVRLKNETYGKPHFTWGQIQKQIEGVEMARAALRAALNTKEEDR